jgi:hypothetical protein
VASSRAATNTDRVSELDGLARRFDHRAFNTGGVPFTDAPGNSWSTGTRTSVQSHYARILAADPAILERNFNDAMSGAKMVIWMLR